MSTSETVYPGHKVLAMFPIYNEGDKLHQLVAKVDPGLVDAFIVVNDGSTDHGPDIIRDAGLTLIDRPHGGLGAAIRAGVHYARENGFTTFVMMAGNAKDDPREIPNLLEPIVAKGFDYVQGSRFLAGGAAPNTPRFRLVAIKLLSWIFSVYMRKKCTDLTNGFRAYRLSIFDDPQINIDQDWLDDYEYEYYVHWKVHRLGYKVTEVAVSKTYPAEKGVRYSHIKPFVGWWRMLRPFVFLSLGLRK